MTNLPDSGWNLVCHVGTRRPEPIGFEAEVLAHDVLNPIHRRLVLRAEQIARTALPGQFVMLTVAHAGRATPALPRPMAIYATNAAAGIVEVMYAIVGSGTVELATFEVGEELYVVGPLGQPFVLPDSPGHALRGGGILLVGRGIGTCSLTTVAQHTQQHRVPTVAVTSARTRGLLIGSDFYREHGARVIEVTDEDGSSDPEELFARLSHELDMNPPTLLLTCGSRRLVRLCERLAQRWEARVQVSLEAHMACGLGYCHGCASGERGIGDESPLICKDGPVFAWQPTPQVRQAVAVQAAGYAVRELSSRTNSGHDKTGHQSQTHFDSNQPTNPYRQSKGKYA